MRKGNNFGATVSFGRIGRFLPTSQQTQLKVVEHRIQLTAEHEVSTKDRFATTGAGVGVSVDGPWKLIRKTPRKYIE